MMPLAQALIVIWEIVRFRICGKRLGPLVPILIEAMERHGHLRLAPEVRTGLLGMSAATIDRVLRDVQGTGWRAGAPPLPAFGRDPAQWRCGCEHLMIGTYPAPGFMEADLVAHSGPIEAKRQLCANTDTDGHCDGVDGVRAVVGA